VILPPLVFPEKTYNFSLLLAGPESAEPGLGRVITWPNTLAYRRTNFSYEDRTWAEFSTLEVAARSTLIYISVKQNGLT
jgi:hypothetical protein